MENSSLTLLPSLILEILQAVIIILYSIDALTETEILSHFSSVS